MSRFPVLPTHPNFGNYQRFDDDSDDRGQPPPFIAPKHLAGGGFTFQNGGERHPLPPPRFAARTPSPTPSESEALQQKGLVNFRGALKNRTKKEKIWISIIAAILIVLTILLAVFHKQIVLKMQPTADKIHNLPAGWLVPVAILFVLSFPPLFGQEIIMVLAGLVWGLWPGFAIVAAGTFLGEVANFYAFKHFCYARGKKLEQTRIDYACLSRVSREGGLFVAIVARYSILPPHFTTAIFATCGMRFWVFAVAAIVSLPRHFITVYLGVLLEDEAQGQNDSKDKIITYVVLAITIVVTYAAVRYIGKLVNAVKPQIVYERRKARQEKMLLSSKFDDDSFSVALVRTTPSALESGPGVYAPPEYELDEADVAQTFAHHR